MIRQKHAVYDFYKLVYLDAIKSRSGTSLLVGYIDFGQGSVMINYSIEITIEYERGQSMFI